MAVIALDLGGTKLAGGLFDEAGELLDRRIAPLGERSGREVGHLISQILGDLLGDADRRGCVPGGVGVSVPGIAYAKSGSVWAPNISGWEDYPLREELEHVLASRPGRVVVDSDRACSIIGERWKGAARGCDHAIFLAVGTGIGAGILVDGRVLRGVHDIAGATGWLALDRPFREEYVPCGCFEYYASGDGIARVARLVLAQSSEYRGPLAQKPRDELTAHDVFAAYDQADPVAQQTLETAVEFWGMATANLVSIFNPDRIIFGGGIFGPAVRFLDEIRHAAAKWAQPISMQHVQLLASELGSDAALYGAGCLALTEGQGAAS
jgi:glucokinase